MHHVPVSNSAPFPVVRIERPDALDSDDELASVLYDVVRYTMPSIDPAQFPSDAIVTQEQFSRLREAVEQELLRQQEERIRIMQEPDQPEHIRRRLQELAQDTETNNRSIMIGAHIEARDIYRRQMEEERDQEQAGTSRGQQSREQEEQQPEQDQLQQEQQERDQLQQEQQEHDQLQPNQQERDQLQENNGWPQEEDEQQEAENQPFDVIDQQTDEMTNEQGEADRIYARVAAMEDDDEGNSLEETLEMLREEWGDDIRGDDPDDVEPLNPFDTRSTAPIPAPAVEPGGWDSPVAGNIMWGGNTQTTAPANWQETQELPAQAPNQDYWQPINDDLEMSDGYTDDAADDDSDSQEEEFDWSFRDHPMNTRTVPEVKLPLRDMLMLTTQKDCHLLAYNAQRTQKEPLSFVTLQMQRRVVSNVDIRMDHELRNLDRLCFLEWVPELELCIMGSQMGCVVLMRVLQVPLPDGEYTYVFNHERYLPLRTLHRHPLYGMTVRRLPSGPMDIYPNYVLDLVYADSCIYSYILSPADPQYNLLFHV
ncbi:hypothetical protein BC940DRAFT_152415 [Gongronella butleri]|nr:hypothetical protein BC940DRAFT_152415 [Gongronella butleri]